MTVINGGDNPNTLFGTLDDDTLNGFGGDDILDGGWGADTYSGGTGVDTILYDQGYNPDGVMVAIGGTGTLGEANGDVIGTDVENIVGTAFTDFLTGSAANNALTGGDGDDTLNGLGGDDVLTGGIGGDWLGGGDGDDHLSGGPIGSSSFDDNRLLGGAGDDMLVGGSGADWLEGGAGADTLIGGEGATTIVYESSSARVQVSLEGLWAMDGEAQGDVIGAGIENIVGSGFDDNLFGSDASNTLVGNGGEDTLRGDAGDDVLDGGEGSDFLSGGAGADTLVGRGGIDTLVYSESAAGVMVNLTTLAVSGGDAQGDVINDDFENIFGSGFADTLTGNAVDNALSGFGGSDSLAGYAGDDLLRGGTGADTIDGGAGVDTATYYESASGVTVDLVGGHGTGGNAQGDTLTGVENLTGSNVGGDSLTGGSGASILRGFGGDDLLRGGAGADTLEGGLGTDLASYYSSAAAVTVSLAAGTGAGGDAQGDILVSIENLNGSSFSDTLTGNGAANALRGLAGRDTLTGGGSADRFVYAAASESAVGANADRITDFSHAQGDRIDLSGIDANGGAPDNGLFTFIGTGLYTGVAGQLRYAVTSPGITTIAGDVNGDGTSDFHIQLTGNLTLVAGDFVL